MSITFIDENPLQIVKNQSSVYSIVNIIERKQTEEFELSNVRIVIYEILLV